MQSSSVSLFLVLGGWCHLENQRDPARQEHDTPWRCPWNAMHFQYAILKLSNGTYLHGREHRSAMRSGLQNLSRLRGKGSPSFLCLDTETTLLWKCGCSLPTVAKSKQTVLPAGHWEERKELHLSVNPRRKQKP